MLTSILDTDLYKLTMQQAVLEHYPEAVVEYRFTNRGKTPFTRRMYDVVQKALAHQATISLTTQEANWLKTRCPFFKPAYIDYLSSFRFKPSEQVSIEFVPESTSALGEEVGRFEVSIKGNWAETILWEVPLMAIISEAYFTVVDTKWDYVGQFDAAREKGRQIIEAGCLLSEFGTRRRRTLKAHDIIMRGLIDANASFAGAPGKGKLAGTSNVHLAQKYDLAPIGTIAHEWIMGIAAITGYTGSNARAMQRWDETYPSGALSIALTDTFSTKPFFEDFVKDPERSRRWKGLRQDSGDPRKFIPVAKEAFERVGADPKEKLIVFSDGLDINTCVELKKASDEAGIGCSFGVGTFLTNDFKVVDSPVSQLDEDELGSGAARTEGERSPALNMVIKLFRINDKYCVKISDELNKTTGDGETVRFVKGELLLEEGAKAVTVE